MDRDRKKLLLLGTKKSPLLSKIQTLPDLRAVAGTLREEELSLLSGLVGDAKVIPNAPGRGMPRPESKLRVF
jgi:hypothetical protein